MLALALPAETPARAATWPAGIDAGPVDPAPLPGTHALAPVRDALPSPQARASRHAPPPARVERFTDPEGHVITIGTSIAGLDLSPVAAILAGTIHGAEIAGVRVLVVSAAQVGSECGGGDGVLACYLPDGVRSTSGEMIVGYDEPDLRHSLVHEYGHHLDAQYENITPAGGCRRSNDGTRRWFFQRERVNRITRRAGCSPRTPYPRLLGEVFAEDYSALNGIQDYVLPIGPPPRSVLTALATDLRQPFRASARSFRGSLRRRRAATRRFHLDTFAFVSATVSGPAPADLDLFIFRRGGRRPVAASTRSGSRERLRELLPPGDYDLDVYAARTAGRYRAVLRLR